MKKLVFASAMALASMSLISAPALRAQDSGQITIQDPAEFNAYQNATTQADPAQKCTALESFLKTYPQTVAKKAALDQLIDSYQATGNQTGMLDAATRLLQVDPGNMKAIYVSVVIKKQLCQKSVDASGSATDTQTCDDAGALAQKGLTVAKPAGTSDADWKNLTAGTYPNFRSAIAFDDAVSKAPTWPAWQANQQVAVGYLISDGVHLQKVTTAGLTGTTKPAFTDAAGAVLTETVFAWPGIGRYVATAVLARDYPAIQGALLVLVAMVMVVNFLVDIAHHTLDPKLRR